MIRLQELTSTRMEEGQQWVVSIDSDEMFLCPFLVTSDVGTMRLLPEQATRLRTYLAKGGVLWVDDFWGTFAWERWLRELHKVLPEAHIVTPTFDHPCTGRTTESPRSFRCRISGTGRDAGTRPSGTRTARSRRCGS